jgi:hypothetical protein
MHALTDYDCPVQEWSFGLINLWILKIFQRKYAKVVSSTQVFKVDPLPRLGRNALNSLLCNAIRKVNSVPVAMEHRLEIRLDPDPCKRRTIEE